MRTSRKRCWSGCLPAVRDDWATNSGFSLRGIGTNVFSINIEPSVAIGEHELLSVTAYNEGQYEVERDVDGAAFTVSSPIRAQAFAALQSVGRVRHPNP